MARTRRQPRLLGVYEVRHPGRNAAGLPIAPLVVGAANAAEARERAAHDPYFGGDYSRKGDMRGVKVNVRRKPKAIPHEGTGPGWEHSTSPLNSLSQSVLGLYDGGRGNWTYNEVARVANTLSGTLRRLAKQGFALSEVKIAIRRGGLKPADLAKRVNAWAGAKYQLPSNWLNPSLWAAQQPIDAGRRCVCPPRSR